MKDGKKKAASGNRTALKNTCPAAKDCGGCAYAGKNYLYSCSEKFEYIKRLMPKGCTVYDINTCDDPFYYRNKVHSGFKRLRNGKIICGLSAGAICWFSDMYTDSEIMNGKSLHS